MSKVLNTRNLSGRRSPRTLLAVSLSFALATFACTTDRNVGNGDPVTTPGVRTTPTSGMSTGSETTPTVPPPSMTSSYTGSEALPPVQARSIRRLSAEQAAMIMADQQPRVKVLGPASPGNGNAGFNSLSNPTGRFINPALITNPEVTVNSSISSGPTTVIASGTGGSGATGIVGAVTADGTIINGGVTARSVSNGTVFTANGTVAGNTVANGLSLGGNVNEGGAVFTPQTNVTLTPTNAGLPVGAGRLAASPVALSPTANAAANLPASAAISPTVAALATPGLPTLATMTPGTPVTGTTNVITTNRTTANATASGSATTSRTATGAARLGRTTATSRTVTANSTARASTANGTTVRVVKATDGRVTVTNVSSGSQR